jgi:hypothetical protein
MFAKAYMGRKDGRRPPLHFKAATKIRSRRGPRLHPCHMATTHEGFSVSVRTESERSPEGTAELSPGRSPGYKFKARQVPQGRLKSCPNAICRMPRFSNCPFIQQPPFHPATALSLQRPSPFCHPEGNREICSAPFVCPAPTGPQPPPIITKHSWKHQPPLCLSAFPGEVRGTADPSVALGMTKRGGSIGGKGRLLDERAVAEPRHLSNLIWTALNFSRPFPRRR